MDVLGDFFSKVSRGRLRVPAFEEFETFSLRILTSTCSKLGPSLAKGDESEPTELSDVTGERRSILAREFLKLLDLIDFRLLLLALLLLPVPNGDVPGFVVGETGVPRNESNPFNNSPTYRWEKTLRSPQILITLRTFSTIDRSRSQIYLVLVAKTGLNASRNLLPRLRFDV